MKGPHLNHLALNALAASVKSPNKSPSLNRDGTALLHFLKWCRPEQPLPSRFFNRVPQRQVFVAGVEVNRHSASPESSRYLRKCFKSAE